MNNSFESKLPNRFPNDCIDFVEYWNTINRPGMEIPTGLLEDIKDKCTALLERAILSVVREHFDVYEAMKKEYGRDHVINIAKNLHAQYERMVFDEYSIFNYEHDLYTRIRSDYCQRLYSLLI